MKKLRTLSILIAVLSTLAQANGVAILDAHTAVYLRLDSTMVNVSVESQISTTVTTQYFTNTNATDTVKYAFPLPEQASAVQLRWRVTGQWYTASVSGNSQDTTLPGGGTGVEEERGGDHLSPTAFELLGNYPNPFNPSTTFQLQVNTELNGPLEIRIYNILGQLVRTLQVQVKGKGVYNVVWDGLGEHGVFLSSGAYFYAVEMKNTVLVGKMNLLK